MPYTAQRPVSGAGLGLRRELLAGLNGLDDDRPIDFMEVAPENWIGVGGRYGRQFRALTERFPFVCHGLSLSIGGPAPLDIELVRAVGAFLDEFDIKLYTEHLSFCSDERGHLYDLMPIPFTEEAAAAVAARIRQVQDILNRQIAIENVSYYAAPGQRINEAEFINQVMSQADCGLLLHVNNLFVNSINHSYDASAFMQRLDLQRTEYIHVAGHYAQAEDLRIDSHGSEVVQPVWDLLKEAFEALGPVPTLVERDFNFPPLQELLDEVAQVRRYQGVAGEGHMGSLTHA